MRHPCGGVFIAVSGQKFLGIVKGLFSKSPLTGVRGGAPFSVGRGAEPRMSPGRGAAPRSWSGFVAAPRIYPPGFGAAPRIHPAEREAEPRIYPPGHGAEPRILLSVLYRGIFSRDFAQKSKKTIAFFIKV